MKNDQNKTVCVIGIWHLGIINAVGFAEKGYRVIGLDFDGTKARKLEQGIPPLYEPGLKEMMEKYLGNGQLIFSDNIRLAKEADWVVIAYDSPVNDKDEVDIRPIEEAAEKVASFLKSNTPLIITSQLPLGSSEKIEQNVKSLNPNWASGVVYTPENLKLGTAIERFSKPDMIVLGAVNTDASKSAQELYEPFETKKITMSLKSAEMVKHALNAFLATSISFGNEIANLADQLGADGVAVGTALKCDQRVGKAPILPGLGFSGGTLARDIKQLKKFSDQLGYRANLIESIITINEDSFDRIVKKIAELLGSIEGKTVGILGLTYKPGTSTMRRSPAIKIIQKLTKLKAKCCGYDPLAGDEEFAQYKDLVARENSPEALAAKSDILVLITEWPEFRDLDFKKLASKMSKPLFVDSKNFIEPEKLTNAGFKWTGYGRKGQL